MASTLPNLEELLEEFSDLTEWDERYGYIIDLGKQLPSLPEELQVESNTVQGCMSTVWMVLGLDGSEAAGKKVRIQADSDSLIIKGLIVVLLSLFDSRTPLEIIERDERQVFSDLGLDQNLSPQRRNGLFAMVQRIKQSAVELAS